MLLGEPDVSIDASKHADTAIDEGVGVSVILTCHDQSIATEVGEYAVAGEDRLPRLVSSYLERSAVNTGFAV